MWLEITHIVDHGWEIKVYSDLIEFKCLTNVTFTTFYKTGHGSINAISTPANLDANIVKLPIGHYTSNYYQDSTGDVLTHSYSYTLSIDVTLVDSNGVSASIMANVRNHNATSENCLFAVGYWRESETTKIVWTKVN